MREPSERGEIRRIERQEGFAYDDLKSSFAARGV